MSFHAEYLMPGSFFSEETTRQLYNYSVPEAMEKAPTGAYAFSLYKLPDEELLVRARESVGPKFKVTPIRYDKSGKFYIGGTIYNFEQLSQLPGDHKTMLSNMRGNNWPLVIHCSTGNWQPFLKEDQLINKQGVIVHAAIRNL